MKILPAIKVEMTEVDLNLAVQKTKKEALFDSEGEQSDNSEKLDFLEETKNGASNGILEETKNATPSKNLLQIEKDDSSEVCQSCSELNYCEFDCSDK